MPYKQLSYMDHCRIYGIWKAAYNQTQITKEIQVHKSTICHEFKRNITFVRTKFGSWQYKPNYAQTYAENRHRDKPKQIKLTSSVVYFIQDQLKEDWSPEQISGYAKRHQLFSISHECIYQYILQDKQKGGELYKHLRHQHKKYRKRYGSGKRQSSIKNRVMIDECLDVVNQKARLGD